MGHSRHGCVSSGGSMRGTRPLWGCQGVRAGADPHAVTTAATGIGRVSDRSGRAADADARRPSMLRRRSLSSHRHAHGAGQLCRSGGPGYGTLRASRHRNARRRAAALKINAFVRTGSTVCATENIVTTHHRDQAVNSDGPSRLETTASRAEDARRPCCLGRKSGSDTRGSWHRAHRYRRYAERIGRSQHRPASFRLPFAAIVAPPPQWYMSAAIAALSGPLH
jgi:hypothetical protein